MMSDNGVNLQNTTRERMKEMHLPHAAHALNLFAISAIEANKTLQKVIKKCKIIVGHFKHSIVASEN